MAQQQAFDAARLRRFEAFCEPYRAVFPRIDQCRRFQAYLIGLLSPGGRKNVETIAAHAAAVLPTEPALSQALQHFVSRSPWDAAALRKCTRESFGDALSDPEAVWGVHDAAFPKKGKHSVGVQRQYARTLGRKVNCQIVVVVSQHGPRGYFPLAARMYLPPFWLRDYPEQVERTVPELYRTPTTKADIALGLIDELLTEGRRPATGAVITENGYATSAEILDGFPLRDLSLGNPSRWVLPRLAKVQAGFDAMQANLGLNHYEGRTWVGWHHHLSLVFAAAAFLAVERNSPDFPSVG